LLVLLFVRHELSYDDWIPDAERIYRYETQITELDGNSIHLSVSPAVTSTALSGHFSEIEAAIRILPALHSLHVENKVYYEWITFAEDNFFDVLDIPLLEGDKATALTGTRSVLVSEEMALKYFGSQSPLGQTLSVEEGNGGKIRDFKVTGVFRDIPMNSHLDLNFIVSKQPNEEDFDHNYSDSWHDFRVYTYLKLAKGTRPEPLEASFPALLDDQVDRARWDGDYSGSDFYQPYLINLTDIHMDTRTEDPMRPVGDRGLVYVLMGIALLILAIASINFMNLALARSMSRAREVSIRKIHGAGRRHLINQYLGETVVLTLLALGLAMIMMFCILPHLNAFVGKDMTLGTLLSWDMVLATLALLLFVAVLAGLYPAFVLSGFRPASNLGGMAGKRAGGARLRAALVVFQFTVSIALGIGAVVIQSQRHYMAVHDLGFSTGDKLVIRWMNWGHFADKSEIINERIRALPEVVGTAYSSSVPGDGLNGTVGMSAPGHAGDVSVRARPLNVDDGFFDVYGVDLIAGRFFSREFGEDYMVSGQPGEKTIRAFPTILSESAVKALGFETAEAAIGATLDVGNDTLEPRVVGVVGDFHFSSLKEPVLPMTYYMSKEEFGNLTIRFRQGANIKTLVQDINIVWHEFIRDPITLEYLDQNVAAHYAEDHRQGVIVTSLAALALFVACMGLYGLSALTAAEWSREVSIRKVHGASTPIIIWLLLWRFLVPVVLAILFAWPLAWFGARQYLDQFSYRIDLGPGFFLVAGLAALLIAGLTVGGHAFKVARANPILALGERV
jgi:putative ABC transport system permease protein